MDCPTCGSKTHIKCSLMTEEQVDAEIDDAMEDMLRGMLIRLSFRRCSKCGDSKHESELVDEQCKGGCWKPYVFRPSRRKAKGKK